MAHYRKSVGAAAGLNAAICVVEAVVGYEAGSLSLLTDCLHNLSDQLALVLLYLAFVLPHGVSRNLLRSANLFNSAGLIVVSFLPVWQAVELLLHPAPVTQLAPIIAGLFAAGGNWGVARLLLKAAKDNAAIRLAYVHNIGDVWVSFAPVAAGLLLTLTGYSFFDPLMAGVIAVWIIASTAREMHDSKDELLWPEKIVCAHPDHQDAMTPAA